MRLLYRVVKTSEAPEDIKRAFEYPVFDAAKAAETVLDPESPEEAEETESDDELDREREEEERPRGIWRMPGARRSRLRATLTKRAFPRARRQGMRQDFRKARAKAYLGIGKRRMTWKRCLRPTS